LTNLSSRPIILPVTFDAADEPFSINSVELDRIRKSAALSLADTQMG
jgi:hypothetical protein